MSGIYIQAVVLSHIIVVFVLYVYHPGRFESNTVISLTHARVRVTLCRIMSRWPWGWSGLRTWLCNSCFRLLVETSHPILLCLLVTCLLLMGGARQSEGVNWCSKPLSVTGDEIWKRGCTGRESGGDALWWSRSSWILHTQFVISQTASQRQKFHLDLSQSFIIISMQLQPELILIMIFNAVKVIVCISLLAQSLLVGVRPVEGVVQHFHEGCVCCWQTITCCRSWPDWNYFILLTMAHLHRNIYLFDIVSIFCTPILSHMF